MIWQFFLLAAVLIAVAYGLSAGAARLLGERRVRRIAPWVRLAGLIPLVVVLAVAH